MKINEQDYITFTLQQAYVIQWNIDCNIITTTSRKGHWLSYPSVF